MKYKFLLPILFFALISTAFSQAPKPKLTDDYFKDIVKKATGYVNDFDKDEFYKKTKFKDKETGKIKEFKDFSKVERTFF